MPDEQHLDNMRQLRKRVQELNANVISDLRPFLNPHDTGTFERLPTTGPEDENDIGVTVTCTCLMTAALTGTAADIYGIEKSEVADKLSEVFDRLLSFRWASSKLPENNAFTSALVLRTAGVICHAGHGKSEEWRIKKRIRPDEALQDGKEIERIDGKADEVHVDRQFHDCELSTIAKKIALNVRENLRVGKYSANPGIGYWFIDAVDELQIPLADAAVAANDGQSNDDENPWTKCAQWACSEFHRHLSMISANHHVLMDPVAMVMAACICKRLRTMAMNNEALQDQVVPFLPSDTELRHGVGVFFDKQLESGVWPKYFPMFHYPGAGANHCWTFEVLEAILTEFDELVSEPQLLERLSQAITWCEQYRLTWRGVGWKKNLQEDNTPYSGWNSGGQQSTLEAGEPESWATGVVHMFLTRLEERLAEAIRRRLFGEYQVSRPVKSDELWTKKTIDSNIMLVGEQGAKSLQAIINDNIIDPIRNSSDQRKLPRSVKRSVLLFGPPGTGKTRFVRAVAQAIGWHFLPINPSLFLTQGLEGIYAQTNKLFSDLRDLYRTVVFFDEMDAMLQTRVDDKGKIQLTVEQQFLTTSMLPHLTELYDDKKVLFFVATNYGKTFDTAITRPGRFDMLLFLGPPSWTTKRENIAQLANLSKEVLKDDDAMAALKATLAEWVPEGHPREGALGLATFGEMRAMLDVLCGEKHFDKAIEDGTVAADSFRETVERWEHDRFALCVSKQLKAQYDSEKDTSEIR